MSIAVSSVYDKVNCLLFVILFCGSTINKVTNTRTHAMTVYPLKIPSETLNHKFVLSLRTGKRKSSNTIESFYFHLFFVSFYKLFTLIQWKSMWFHCYFFETLLYIIFCNDSDIHKQNKFWNKKTNTDPQNNFHSDQNNHAYNSSILEQIFALIPNQRKYLIFLIFKAFLSLNNLQYFLIVKLLAIYLHYIYENPTL